VTTATLGSRSNKTLFGRAYHYPPHHPCPLEWYSGRMSGAYRVSLRVKAEERGSRLRSADGGHSESLSVSGLWSGDLHGDRRGEVGEACFISQSGKA